MSAQAPGVEGGGIVIDIPGVPPVALAPLREWDPQRYGSLSHPGDAYSYDIFSQVAQLVRRPGAVDPLGGVSVDHVIAVGESQSAGRIATYANAIEPLTGIYDGFFIHGRSDGASPINDDPSLFAPEPTYLRSDADAPMLQFETETDLIFLGNIDARQDDSETLVTWEVAGTAHADRSYVDYGVASAQLWIEGVHNDPTEPCGAINDGPQPDVARAAFVALYDWVVDDRPPPTAPRIETAGGDIVRDEYGNAVGGVRTPPVDAPVSSLTGITPAENLFCLLFGAAVPLTDAQLAGRYTDHADYVAQVTASADAALEAGFLLPADRDTFVAAAEAADVP